MAAGADIVATTSEAAGAERPPLVVLDRLEAFLDEHGLGEGPVRAERIGDGGGSNFSFLLERGDDRFVLRRPPRPPLPPSAHDMVREARLQLALAPHGIRLPPIVAICEEESVIGVPFYVMRFLDGHVVTSDLPAGLEEPAARRRLGEELVDALVEIHSADVSDPALDRVRPPRQLPRASGAPLRAAVGDQRDARDPGRRRGGRPGSPTSCPSPFPTRSSTATTASAT